MVTAVAVVAFAVAVPAVVLAVLFAFVSVGCWEVVVDDGDSWISLDI